MTGGDVFRLVRTSMGMTQREFGALVGRSASHVGRIERDENTEPWDRNALARALGQHMGKVAH